MLPREQVAVIAEARVDGTVIGVEGVNDGGKVLYDVEVDADGQTFLVRVDPADGTVVRDCFTAPAEAGDTVVSDDVIVLGVIGDTCGALLDAEAQDGVDFTALHLAAGLDVRTGSILVSGMDGQLAPYGFILRVTSVETAEDGTLHVEVEPAGLEDVFVHADINLSAP